MIEALVEEKWLCKLRTRLGTPTSTRQDEEGGLVLMIWENPTSQQIHEADKLLAEDTAHYIRHLSRSTL